jgi:hypothetical protein
VVWFGVGGPGGGGGPRGGGQASVDHVVPRSAGGTNAHSNLITSCIQCNAKRNDRGVTEFAGALVMYGGSPERVEEIVRRVRNAQRRKLPR